MKTLDWYIIRKFLGTFFLIIAIIMLVSVVFDISEKIEDFIENEAPLGEIVFDYYLNFMAYYGNLFSAFLVFITVVVFTSRLASRSEFVAMLSGGIKFSRLLRPYMIAATFLVVLSLLLNHIFLPMANSTRLEFEEEYLRSGFRQSGEHFNYELKPGTIVYFKTFNYTSNMAHRFSLEKWENDEIVYKLFTDRATYDTSSNKWNLVNFTIRERIGDEQRFQQGALMDTVLGIKPTDFARRVTFASSMGYREISDYIAQEKAKGSDKVAFIEIEKHQRTSYPFATYILTLIGVSISCRKIRGGIGLHIAYGFSIVFSYIFAMRVASVSATNLGVDALVAVWIPNAIFLVLGLVLLRYTPK